MSRIELIHHVHFILPLFPKIFKFILHWEERIKQHMSWKKNNAVAKGIVIRR